MALPADECGKEYSYEPGEVLRFELELSRVLAATPTLSVGEAWGLSAHSIAPTGPNALDWLARRGRRESGPELFGGARFG
jgi:hypothetical protein